MNNIAQEQETITLAEIIERALHDDYSDNSATPESLQQAFQEWKGKEKR